MSQTKDLIVCLSYARSGGTMLSQVLGHHSSILMFSEVNPKLNAVSSIKEQAKKWYGIDLRETNFEKSVHELLTMLEEDGRKTLLRDFSFIDFTPHQLNEYHPLNNFGTIQTLKSEYNLKTFAFVRDAFDVWISRDCPPEFSKYYLNYVKELKDLDIRIFKYEDFCENPVHELEKICKYLNVNFEAKCLEGVSKNEKSTGDIDLAYSRGRTKKGAIQVLKRKQLPVSLKRKANADTNLLEANLMLGYATDINEKQYERASTFKTELKWFFRKITRKHPSAKY